MSSLLRFSRSAVFAAAFVLLRVSASAQSIDEGPRTVTLEARRIADGVDNYQVAAFGFKHGVNGKASLETTHNNWDILFGNSPQRDSFDVTMVVDDRSRIKDLGAYDWAGIVEVPGLPAYEKPTREPSVAAVVGHIYVVHSADSGDDHYSLFRVEALEPGKTVTITWKRVAWPE